jgi:hypothetical protein
MPKSQEDKELQNKADRVKDAIKQENDNGGAAKQNEAPNEGERTDPGQPKPQPKAGDMSGGGMADPKPQPKPDANARPNAEAGRGPVGRQAGRGVEKPPEPSTAKPDDKKPGEPKGDEKNAAPAEKRDQPQGGAPGRQ